MGIDLKDFSDNSFDSRSSAEAVTPNWNANVSRRHILAGGGTLVLRSYLGEGGAGTPIRC